jgi:hypothetical protein
MNQPPQRAWVVKLSPAGAVDWQWEYRGGVTEWLACVVPTGDGGCAVAGTTNSSGAGTDDAFVMKLDRDGAIDWQMTFGGGDADQVTELVELSSGGYAVAGWTNSFTPSGHAPWVLRLDAGGQLVWNAVVGDQEWGDLDAITESRDGDVVAFGRVGQPGFPTNDLWAAELAAADGSVSWQRAYEGDSGDWGSQVMTLAGGGLLFGGEWASGFADEAPWVIRTGPSGRLPGCDIERKTRFVTSDPHIVTQPAVTVREAAGALLQPVDFQNGSSHAAVEERCTGG